MDTVIKLLDNVSGHLTVALEDFRLFCMSHWPGLYSFKTQVVQNITTTYIGVLAVVVLIVLFLWIAARLYVKLTVRQCDPGIRMDGKTVLITGSNIGIGLETARDLSGRGARVIMACRNLQKGADACRDIIDSTGNENIVLRKLDLASMSSVRKFAREIIETEKRLDVLILNAGIALTKKYMTEDNFELHMATNHFGHFLLTNLLIPFLKESGTQDNPSRIIAVSSVAHYWGNIDTNNLNSEKYYEPSKIYGTTKLANILFIKCLAERLKPFPITANVLHPGAVQTGLYRHIPYLGKVLHAATGMFCLSAEEGAQTSIYLAASPDVKKVSGEYFIACRAAKCSKTAQDLNLAYDLWNKSVDVLDMEAEEMTL